MNTLAVECVDSPVVVLLIRIRTHGNSAEANRHMNLRKPPGQISGQNPCGDFTSDPANPGFFFAETRLDTEVRTNWQTKGAFSGSGLQHHPDS